MKKLLLFLLIVVAIIGYNIYESIPHKSLWWPSMH